MLTSQSRVLRCNWLLIKKIYAYNKLLFFVRILFATIGSLSSIVTVLLPLYLIEALMSNDMRRLIFVVGGYLIIKSIIQVLTIFYNNYYRVASEKMYVAIINELLRKSLTLDLCYFHKSESYAKFSRAFSNCCSVVDRSNDALQSALSAVIRILMLIGLALWLSPVSAVMVVVFTFISVFFNKLVSKIGFNYNLIFSKYGKRVNYMYRLFYTPQFIRDIKANVMEDFIFIKKDEINDEILRLTEEQTKKTLPHNVVLTVSEVLEYSAMALYFGIMVIVGRIYFAAYFTTLAAYQQARSAFAELMQVYSTLYENSLFAEDYLAFMETDEDATYNPSGIVITAAEINKIEFEDVVFTYPNTDAPALDKVTFVINKGEKIAIVGKNGAGKTTIIKLLLRLYVPDSGQIKINGADIAMYCEKSLRMSIKTIFQDYAMYALSIYDNITLGRKYSINDVQAGLEAMDMKKKVDALEKGVDTPITSQVYDGGVEFSGGETQKIALARIFVGGTGFVVLDEPTSSLDPYAEYELYKKLLNDMSATDTVIVISHRLTLTHKMTKIMVIDSGKIKEEGTHNELLSKKGIYAEMYSIQAEKYIEG